MKKISKKKKWQLVVASETSDEDEEGDEVDIDVEAVNKYVRDVKRVVKNERKREIGLLRDEIAGVALEFGRVNDGVGDDGEVGWEGEIGRIVKGGGGVKIGMGKVRWKPRGVTWSKVNRNYREATSGTAEDGIEKGPREVFVPYLGDSEVELMRSDDLAMHFCKESGAAEVDEEEGEEGDGGVCGDYESDCENLKWERVVDENEVMIGWGGPLERFFCRKQVLKRGLMRRVVRDTVEKFGKKDAVLIVLAMVLGVTVGVVECCESLCRKRIEEWKKWDKEKREEVIICEQQDGAARGIKEAVTTAEEFETADGFSAFFCRQCYTYDCHQHGINYPRPKGPLPDSSLFGDPAKRGEPCSEACYIYNTLDNWDALNKPFEAITSDDLTREEEMLYAKDLRKPFKCWRLYNGVVITDKVVSVIHQFQQLTDNAICKISQFIGISPSVPSEKISCMIVALVIQQLLPPYTTPKSLVAGISSKKHSFKRRRVSLPNKELESLTKGYRTDYSPCSHEGSCKANVCQCYERGVNCEKYCCCYRVRTAGNREYPYSYCYRQFRGCNCKSLAGVAGLGKDVGVGTGEQAHGGEEVQVDVSGTCVANKCPCIESKRECDPDMCENCCVRDESGVITCCSNTSLRHHKWIEFAVGESEIHGWGCFALESVKKGRCIGEYVGEIVLQDEAERRGRVYDELNSSFLFNITQDKAVDATRCGNLLKYCNHSKNANVIPYLMRVAGDIRIGMYAKRNIEVGEELVFDYGYADVASHIAKWAGSKPRMRFAKADFGKNARER